jgi:hypothetical protein
MMVMMSGLVRVLVAVPVVVMRVLVVRVLVVRVAVRAALGFETAVLEAQRESETANQVVEHVIVLISKSATADLERNVPIAEVVSGARKQERVVGRCHAERFVGGHDLEGFAVVGEQAIAVREHGAARQLDGDFLAVFQTSAKARLVALVEAQNQP